MLRTEKSFGKASRILKNAEFRRIFKQGRRFNAPELTLVIQSARGSSSGKARLGLSISRKVGDSPVRNRLKRRMREIFRLNQGNFEAGTDIVLVGKKETSGLGYQELQRLFLSQCERAKALRNGGPS